MSSTRFRELSVGTKLYICSIVVAGAAIVLQSFYDLAVRPIGWNWAVLAILTLVSGSATVRLPSLPATISVSETFVFTSVLLFGSAAGTLTVALDALVISFWSYRKGHPTYKIVFNVCALPLTIWLAAHVFFLFPSIQPLVSVPRAEAVKIKDLLGPLLLFTVLYFSLNSWIITLAISLEQRLPAFTIWRDNFLWLSLNYFGGASVAALLVSYTRDLDYTYLVVIVPLLVVLYFTFSMSMGRIEDANRHLTQLNSLYMSTIETLAMAIDAKDQITHGHIRRVQSYAVTLAKHVGITDVSLIRAVEAAALLHDMGKLAVPEYILNKPGPLTSAEFDKMKLHASVGADILSAIDFPYPVVPIVRHHHENWDGTGYPDGLSGTNIPIGARILSVVDCFDALTSDRPYRPKLTDKDAIRILLDRRGTMYDPLIVDTFLRVHTSLYTEESNILSDPSLLAVAGAAGKPHLQPPQTKRFDDIAGSAEETLTLLELARDLAAARDLIDVTEKVSTHLRRLIPCSLCVLFLYDVDADEIVACHAAGDNAPLLSGLRIRLGQRLSGWVAAHKQTIRNSDPVLDIGEAVRSIEPRLRSCLSTPIVSGKGLVGVLTLYSTSHNAFNEEHQRVAEAVSRQIGATVEHFSAIKSADKSGPLELPNVEHLQRLTDAIGAYQLPSPASLLVIGIAASAEPRRQPPAQHEQQLLVITALVKQTLRTSDLLLRHGDREIVALLARTDLSSAASIGNRIQRAAKEAQVSIYLHVSPVLIEAPDRNLSIVDIIQQAIARTRRKPPVDPLSDGPPGSVH